MAAKKTEGNGATADPRQVPGAEAPAFVPIAKLKEAYVTAFRAETNATTARALAEHELAKRIRANKNKPFPMDRLDGKGEQRWTSRLRKGCDESEAGSLALSAEGEPKAGTVGSEY